MTLLASVSGRSSGVEHNLAKVGVGRSNRLARSIFFDSFVNYRPLGRTLESCSVFGCLLVRCVVVLAVFQTILDNMVSKKHSSKTLAGILNTINVSDAYRQH